MPVYVSLNPKCWSLIPLTSPCIVLTSEGLVWCILSPGLDLRGSVSSLGPLSIGLFIHYKYEVRLSSMQADSWVLVPFSGGKGCPNSGADLKLVQGLCMHDVTWVVLGMRLLKTSLVSTSFSTASTTDKPAPQWLP